MQKAWSLPQERRWVQPRPQDFSSHFPRKTPWGRVYFGFRQPRFHADDSDERLREGYLKIVKGELRETLSGQTITVLDSLNVKIKQSFGIKLTPDEKWNY